MSPLLCLLVATIKVALSIDTSWSDALVYPSYTVNVRDFGAVGDGMTNDTDSILAAIEHVSQYIDKGTQIKGGIVSFSAGAYLVGYIGLLSNTFLYLDKKATIYGATNWTWYPPEFDKWVTIGSNGVNNIGIFGDGIINGQNHKFINHYDSTLNKYIPNAWEGVNGCTGECRPRLVQFVNSTNITLKGTFGLLNSPDWTSHYLNCQNVLIDGIHVWNDRLWPNGDGIDPENTQNMIIRNVNINTGDDSICPKNSDKSGMNPTRNILVENAFISSHSSAIKFGSTTVGEMYDFVFRNISIIDSNRGLGIQMRGNGSVHDIVYENINIETRWWDPTCNSWWGDGDPIWITAIQRSAQQIAVGSIYNITFNNITIRSENGIFISGIGNPLSSVYNISFNNIEMVMDDWDLLYQHPSYDYRPSYGNYSQCVASTVDAIRLQSVKNINITNFNVTFNMMDKQTFWDKCIDKGDSENIVTTNFNCNL